MASISQEALSSRSNSPKLWICRGPERPGAMGYKGANVQKFGGEDEFLVRMEKVSEDLEGLSKSMQASLQERSRDKGLRFEGGIGGARWEVI